MRALGASFIYAVQTWRQLAAVAEPRGCGRMLIIAPGRRRAPTRSPQLSPSPLDGHRLVAPDRESAEVGGLRPRRSTNPFLPGVVLLRGPVQTIRGAERLH
jgi:hypothetical protein